MLTSSKKAKGRSGCKLVKDLLHKNAPLLHDLDINVTPSGVTGVDLYLSPAALEVYPFAIECKVQEKLNIWASLEQSESHRKPGLVPLLFFKRNRSELYVCMKADELFTLIKKS